MAYVGCLVGIWSLHPDRLTLGGFRERSRLLTVGTWTMLVV